MEDDSGDAFGGVPDQFHHGEAISAVQDEDTYLGEEDEDYDDLYNDVNVGENFLQTFRRDEEEGFPRETQIEKKAEPFPPPPLPLPLPQRPPSMPAMQQPPLLPPPPPLQQQPPSAFPERPTLIPGIGGDSAVEGAIDGSRGYTEAGLQGPGEPAVARAPVPGYGVPRPDMSQPSIRPAPLPGPYAAPSFPGDGFMRQQAPSIPAVVVPGAGAGANYNMNLNGGGGAIVSSGTVLFVGDLHWWTTDADLESELCKYGQVKELKFFDERASGKSKGYCQVEFFDPMAAATCKEGMNGHVFNGRACVVAFASPNTVRRMGEAQVSKTQVISQTQAATAQGRGRVGGITAGGNQGRGGGGGGGGAAAGGGSGNVGGGWGRGGGMGGRGQVGGMRNRMGAAGGRGIMGNGGLVTPPPPPPVLHPGTMLPQGFDPTGAYGAAMGRMAGAYAGFPGGPGGPPFPGMLPSFPPVVAPHVNPAFFGRGMPPGGMGMWPDPNVASWGGEEQSSYGEEAVSDQQYGEVSHAKDRASDRRHRDEREKDEGAGSEWSERRHHDERDAGRERDRDRDRERDRERERERDRERDREKDRDRERDRHRDDRDRHDHRHRDDDWERSRSSRTRSRSREHDHSKRRRASPR